jgi:hypothetical protein
MDWVKVGIIAFTYAIAANIIYTGGWIAEWLLRKANNFDAKITYVGPIFFAMSLVIFMLTTFFGGLFAGYLNLLVFAED